MTAGAVQLPKWTVQADWHDVVEEVASGKLHHGPEAQFWVSVYRLNEAGIHGHVRVLQTEGQLQLDGGKDFDARLLSKRSLSLTLKSRRSLSTVTIRSPIRAPAVHLKRRVRLAVRRHPLFDLL